MIYYRAKQGNHERDCGYGKIFLKSWDEGFPDMGLGEIQVLIGTTPEE